MSLSKYSESEINEFITPWRITDKLGEGASAEVFEVVHINENPPESLRELSKVALKVISIPSDEKEIDLNRINGMSDEEICSSYREIADNIISTIQKLRSFGVQKNIVNYSEPVKIINKDNIGWTVFVPMELLEPFETAFPKGEIPDIDKVIKLGIDICDALQVCHDNNLLHRDIKPANILVDKQGSFKIADFGIAKVKEKTITDISARGTENYMAPEIIRKDISHTGDFTADLYSLAIILFELLNDRRFPTNPDLPSLKTHDDNTLYLSRKLTGNLSFIAKHEDGKLIDIIAKTCNVDISKRYKSASEMRADLSAALKEKKTKPLFEEKDREVLFFGHYFGEPISWIVLEHGSKTKLLLSQYILDSKEFNSENTRISWEETTLRSWLNGYGADVNDYGLDYSKDNFINIAFSQDEIKRLVPIDNDKVSLLTEEDVFGTEKAISYGFCTDRTVSDPNRSALATTIAFEKGLHRSNEMNTSAWWLRSPGIEKNRAMFVDSHGIVCCNGATVFDKSFGIRPVIQLKD